VSPLCLIYTSETIGLFFISVFHLLNLQCLLTDVFFFRYHGLWYPVYYFFFEVQVIVHRDKFLQQNQLHTLISQIYFWSKTLYVSDSSSVHHQELFTVHTAMISVIQLASRISMELPVPSWSCSQAVSQTVWHIPLLCVQWETPDDGQRNCPKHVEFYSKNKFEKLVHLVGFIIGLRFIVRIVSFSFHFWFLNMFTLPSWLVFTDIGTWSCLSLYSVCLFEYDSLFLVLIILKFLLCC